MAVKVNQSGPAQKLFTGIATCSVLAVNPTKAELEALKIKTEKEPKYLDTENKRLRVAFLLEFKVGPLVQRTSLSYFLKNEQVAGLYLNDKGGFGKDKEKVSAGGGNVRAPYDGEISVLNMVSNLCNTKKGDDLSLETIATMVTTGNVKELKDMVKAARENQIKALLGVSEDGKYQRVYTKKLERGYSNDYSYIHKSLVENQAYVKDDFGPIDLKLYVPSDFRLREWTGESSVEKSVAGYNAAASSNGQAKHESPSNDIGPSSTESPENNSATDDLPF